MTNGTHSTTDATFVALVRATLGTDEVPDARRLAACDWTRVEALAAHHAVGPIVYQALESATDAVPRDVVRRFWLEYRATAHRHRAVAELAADVGRRFSAAGIPSIVLKGAALVRTLYTDPGLRRVGDLDLLVGEPDVPHATCLLEAMGFGRIGRPLRTEWPTCEFHVVYHRDRPGSVPVELHWRLFEDYLPYVFDLAQVWRRARPVADLPADMRVMSVEHELAHLCIHLERHALVYRSVVDRLDWLALLVRPRGMARLGWLYDVALSLRRHGDTLDWDRFVADARRWVIDDRVRVVLELCERALGVAAPAEVRRALGRRRQSIVERSAHRAIIALDRAGERLERRRASSGWLDLLGNRAEGWSHMWTSLFPPSVYLAARHAATPSSRRRAQHLATMTPKVLHAIGRRLGLERRRDESALGAGQAMVVVPVYKTEPNAHEAISWKRCLEVFATHPIALVAPEGLDVTAYVPPGRAEAERIRVVRFDPGFFRSLSSYSDLMLSAGFYRAFASYEFILVHQLDVFVFRDELANWCARGWDYVGAPWEWCEWIPEAKHQWPPATRDNVVGNGGFSLRRVSTALKVLAETPDVPARWTAAEDQFWSFEAPARTSFNIPPLQEAVAFSFEVAPDRAFALNGSKLPFGCHAWNRGAQIDFWRPHLKRCGYEV